MGLGGRVRRGRGSSSPRAGRGNRRRPPSFWGEVLGPLGPLGAGPRPGMRPPPAHALCAQDAADLAASDPDPLRVGRGGQRIERPLRHVSPLAARRGERPVGIGDQPTGWRAGSQRDARTALGLGAARRAAATGLHAQPSKPALLERLEALADGLGVAVQLRGACARARSLRPNCARSSGHGQSSRRGHGDCGRIAAPGVPQHRRAVGAHEAIWA